MKKIRKISMKTINKKVFVLALGMAMASLGCHGMERRERSQLHLAAMEGDLEVVEKLVGKKHEFLNLVFNWLLFGNWAVVRKLLDSKLDCRLADVKDNYGWTPLHWAAMNGHLEVVKYLVENGADVNAKDNNGFTPLSLAAWKGSLNVVKYLFENGADVKEKCIRSSTPLHWTAFKGSLEMVKFLVKNKAYVNAKDFWSSTPLHYAAKAKNGHLNVVKFLVENGADVNAKDNNDFTPLHWALVKGHLEMVKYLV